jgi:hypothetical protein
MEQHRKGVYLLLRNVISEVPLALQQLIFICNKLISSQMSHMRHRKGSICVHRSEDGNESRETLQRKQLIFACLNI